MGSSESHLERMKELEIQAKRIDRERQKELENIRKANKRTIEERIRKYEKRLCDTMVEIKRLKEQELTEKGEFSKYRRRRNKFADRKNKEIEQWKLKHDFDQIKKNLDIAKNEISEAIKQTSVMESNVSEFLTLTHKLVNGTTKNQIQANKLASIIETFNVTLQQKIQKHLSIETYFSDNKLERLIPIFEEQGMDTMNELICDDKNEFEELIQELNEGIEEQINTWDETKENDDEPNKEKPQKISTKEKRKLKTMCLKPQTWQKLEEDQQKTAKKTLESISPVLSKFFNNSYKTMESANKILNINFGSQLSLLQQEKIQDMQNLNLKRINYTSQSRKQQENNNNNNNINNNLKIEKVSPNNQLQEQTELLNQAAIVSIDIVDGMKEDFDNAGESAKGLALGVEISCKDLIESQGSIRQSWVLANEIFSLKPSNLKDESKRLWDAVDKGVIQIHENILAMSKVSASFFGFFIKFSNSFNYFMDANKDNVDLTISMQHIIKNAKDFKNFSITFENQVQKLEQQALKVISNCVENGRGAKQFNEAMKQRDINKEKYTKLCKQLNKKIHTLDEEKRDIESKFEKAKRNLESLTFQIDLAQKNYVKDQEAKKKCEDFLLYNFMNTQKTRGFRRYSKNQPFS